MNAKRLVLLYFLFTMSVLLYPLKLTQQFSWDSRHVWKGLIKSRGSVWQSRSAAGFKPFGLEVNSIYDNDLHELDEADIRLSSTWRKGNHSLCIGGIHYMLEKAPDTTDLFIDVRFRSAFTMGAAYYRNIDGGRGGYSCLSLSREIILSTGASVTPELSVHSDHGDRFIGSTASTGRGPYSLTFRLSVTVPLNRLAEVTGQVGTLVPLQDTPRSIRNGIVTDSCEIFSGINISLGF